MFALQIHSVDFPQPLPTATTSAVRVSDASDSIAKLNPAEQRGVAHLFRHLPPSTSATYASALTGIANPIARTTTLFVVAVPNYLSSDDFLLFCASHVEHFTGILFLRNDVMEDRYSVLITLVSQLAADGFYCSYNGKRFKPTEGEVCHIYFTQSVECAESAEIASIPPPGYTELPTCPVCLERLDQDTSGIQSTLCDHSFHCSCVSKWTYSSCQVCRLCQQQDERPTCSVCGTPKNLWVCLICGFVGCGRYEEKHAIRHWSDTQHHYSLELETQQIWDYVGDKYVHRLNQSKTDGKPATMNSSCAASDGECGMFGYDEDPGLSGALYNSKVEAVVDEYNILLASQLETQRQHYESLLAEERSGKESTISKAVEKALFSKTHELQSRIEKCEEEKKVVTERNKVLMEKQEKLQKNYKEIEKRETLLLKSKDEHIQDLEEQIRDIKVYIEAQKKLANMGVSDGKDGTVLSVESNQSSSGGSRRRTKQGRRR
nr:BRCA1-associated protein [Ipomoea batatas]